MTVYILFAVVIALLMIVIVLLLTRKNNNGDNLLVQRMDIASKQTDAKLDGVTNQMQNLTEKNYQMQIKLMETLNANAEKQANIVSQSITAMQKSNEEKLEQMRLTVDEKLTQTLTSRLDSSFKTVSQQLQNVYQSLGEMRELSAGVTDGMKGLNTILTNVKSRGTWAEIQLGNILDQTIAGLYETNVRTNPKYNGQVEFAVKIPNADDDSITWLPIDSKFPMEDYIRLTQAAESGNLQELEKAQKALEMRVKEEAKAVSKYISVPETTPFAILYLATEGLYAEIMRSKNTIVEQLQQQGIMLAGPSTITALLNSLAMGFRSVAINKKANEVWKVLGAAKAQYNKFGELLVKARRKVDEAGRVLDEAGHRNDMIQKNLKNVETLELNQSNDLFNLEA